MMIGKYFQLLKSIGARTDDEGGRAYAFTDGRFGGYMERKKIVELPSGTWLVWIMNFPLRIVCSSNNLAFTIQGEPEIDTIT